MPPSPSSSAFSLVLFLSEQQRSLDVIVGDGNCLFRAIAKELFGDQKHHVKLREILMDYITTNSNSFKQFLTSCPEGGMMEHCSRVRKLGTFATQVEIYAFSHFLNMPIYVYTMTGLASTWKWLLYSPNRILKYHPLYNNFPLALPPNYHIELCHTNGNHFDRVVPTSQIFGSPHLSYLYSDYPALSGVEDKENVIEL